ncbi:MAG TPA: hypothetical protein PLM51_05620 [Bacillota bacterium]|nr:hypothetical protein [Bacillota bacterium]
MKVLGRIFYAIAAVIVFLFVYDYTTGIMTTYYIEKYGVSGLEQEEPDYFFFYSNMPDYNRREPLFEYDLDPYEIRFYEIAAADVAGDTLTVDEYAYILIHSKTDDLSGNYYLNFSDSADPESEGLTINIVRFRSISLFIAIDNEGYARISKDVLLTDAYDTVTLVSEGGEVIFTVPFALADADFQISSAIEQYYDENGTLPSFELESAGIYPKNNYVMTEFQYIFYLGMGIYLTVLAVTTYFVFFRKKKYMGKVEPTTIFKAEKQNKKPPGNNLS